MEGCILRPRFGFLQVIYQYICSTNPKLYINYLRKKGVTVGEGTRFFGRSTVDLTRPVLVEIGRNCMIADNTTILTHGFDWSVLREKYGEVLSSSGKVTIEDNVFIGTGTIILKGVRIGRDSIIGAGSVVTSDIPAGSVAAGNPCKVIMTIDQYYQNRKKKFIDEAKAYAYEIFVKTGRIPYQEEFWEEFPIFLNRKGNWGNIPVKSQTGSAFINFLKSKPVYSSYEEFLIDAGIPREKVSKGLAKK